jgi:hypothetical protein
MLAGELGMIVTPNQGNRLPYGVKWCADNGCGPTRTGPVGSAYPGDDAFLAWLDKLSDRATDCRFAVAPDVLGDAAATLARSLPMMPKIRAMGYKVALVAQDGLEHMIDQIPWDDFDALFIGGSTEFKLSPGAARIVAEAKRHGKWVHMGRVNSRKRLMYAYAIGCDSADGTYLVYGPSVNLPKLMGWLDEVKATHTVNCGSCRGRHTSPAMVKACYAEAA